VSGLAVSPISTVSDVLKTCTVFGLLRYTLIQSVFLYLGDKLKIVLVCVYAD